MKFEQLLRLLDGETIFQSSLLLAGSVSASTVYKQITRWVSSGKLIQLRRGIYVIAKPYREKQPHPFLIANKLKKGFIYQCTISAWILWDHTRVCS